MADTPNAAEIVEPIGYSSAELMAELPKQVFDGEAIVTQEAEANPPEGETEPLEDGPKSEAPPEGDKTGEEPPSPPGKKYKSWEEAEEGAREHQRFATEKAEEAKRAKEAQEKAEREAEELRQKLIEKEKPPEKPTAPAKTAEELEAEQEARIEAALDEINQLDDYDPDYRKKAARAWRKTGLVGAGQASVLDPKVLNEIIDQRVEEQLRAKEAALRAETEAERLVRVRQEAAELATKSGLDLSEEDSADAILFWTMTQKLPPEYDTKPLKSQVDWVVGEVRKRTGKVVEMTAAERDKARKIQERNAILERGSNRPAKKPPEEKGSETYTTADILKEVQEERRIRG